MRKVEVRVGLASGTRSSLKRTAVIGWRLEWCGMVSSRRTAAICYRASMSAISF